MKCGREIIKGYSPGITMSAAHSGDCEKIPPKANSYECQIEPYSLWIVGECCLNFVFQQL